MEYYRLRRNLPTFKAGDLFYINRYGNLYRTDGIMAYAGETLKKFPNILGEWFEELTDMERDANTKSAFIKYLDGHKEERFFQAIRNFTKQYLDKEANFICASDSRYSFEDTFNWECDDMLEEKIE